MSQLCTFPPVLNLSMNGLHERIRPDLAARKGETITLTFIETDTFTFTFVALVRRHFPSTSPHTSPRKRPASEFSHATRNGSYSTFDASEELRTIHPPGRVAAYSKRPANIDHRLTSIIMVTGLSRCPSSSSPSSSSSSSSSS